MAAIWTPPCRPSSTRAQQQAQVHHSETSRTRPLLPLHQVPLGRPIWSHRTRLYELCTEPPPWLVDDWLSSERARWITHSDRSRSRSWSPSQSAISMRSSPTPARWTRSRGGKRRYCGCLPNPYSGDAARRLSQRFTIRDSREKPEATADHRGRADRWRCQLPDQQSPGFSWIQADGKGAVCRRRKASGRGKGSPPAAL